MPYCVVRSRRLVKVRSVNVYQFLSESEKFVGQLQRKPLLGADDAIAHHVLLTGNKNTLQSRHAPLEKFNLIPRSLISL